MLAASVPDETVSTPCIRPVPVRIIPVFTVNTPGKYDVASALLIYALFLPAHPLLQLSGEELISNPASAFK